MSRTSSGKTRSTARSPTSTSGPASGSKASTEAGWGTTTADLADQTVKNFVAGSNLLALHGLYYSTHGGWWEWAPPCNFFRMPYWPHMAAYLRYGERLSYLLSQGVHRCDVAVMYPVAPMEAGMEGEHAVETAFAIGERLFGPRGRAIDFDFMDFESLDRAEIVKRELGVAGERFRALILPSMAAVRFSTVKKAREFYRAGGLVIAVGALPGASDRAGRDDPELEAAVKEIFGVTAGEAAGVARPRVQRNGAGGAGWLLERPEEVPGVLTAAFTPDFAIIGSPQDGAAGQALHRKIGPRDVYLVVGAPGHAECFFRAHGRPELWDPWTGNTRPIHGASVTAEGTRLRLPDTGDAQLVVFNPGAPDLTVESPDLDENPNSKEAAGAAATVALDGPWEFELKPTMDNRFGDFHWPPTTALIGAEARRFRYAEEKADGDTSGWSAAAFDDSAWRETTCSFGPQFWKLGPFPPGADLADLEKRLLSSRAVDTDISVKIDDKIYRWEPYEFSHRWGVEGKPGEQGYHGLKEIIRDEFIDLPNDQPGSSWYLWTVVRAPQDARLYLQTSNMGGGIQAWLDGAATTPDRPLDLRAGGHPMLARLTQASMMPVRAYAAFERLAAARENSRFSPGPQAMSGFPGRPRRRRRSSARISC